MVESLPEGANPVAESEPAAPTIPSIADDEEEKKEEPVPTPDATKKT